MTFAARSKWIRFSVLTGLAAAFFSFAGLGEPVHAQDPTLIIGNQGGSPVDVDLSVLSDRGQQGRGQLLFPGSRFLPGQPIVLRPPRQKSTRLKRPSRRLKFKRKARRTVETKRRRASRRAAPMAIPAAPPKAPRILTRPKAKPKPPLKKKRSRVAAAPKKKAPPKVTKRVRLPKPPPRPPLIVAKPKPRPKALSKTAMAPLPVPPKAERKSPPPAPVRDKAPRVSLPPPPAPPVVAAPRTPVASAPIKKKLKPAAKQPGAGRQVAAIPRVRAIAVGSSQRILFPPGSARLAEDGQAALKRISIALKNNPALRLQLKAYARGSAQNPSQARRLSLSRALAVRANLMKQGVRPTRIDVQALGNKVPDGPPNRVDLVVSSR